MWCAAQFLVGHILAPLGCRIRSRKPRGKILSLDWLTMEMKLKKASQVSTATVVAAGLIGGWLTARESGIRPLGTIPLAASGALAARSWNEKKGPAVATGLLATYVGAFGLSHPLAKKIGAWPAVLTVTAGAAAIAYAVSDSQ